MEILEKSQKFPLRRAIISNGNSRTYNELYHASTSIARSLLGTKIDLNEEPIAFMVDPSYEYTATLLAIWAAGGIAVPLCLSHPLPSLKYVLEDTGATTVICTKKYCDKIEIIANDLQIELLLYEDLKRQSDQQLPIVDIRRRAMILYTSGTTSKPKGVVLSHRNIEAQIRSLVSAWEWSENDHILNTLPLHHVHGIVNILLCALWSGATCEFLPKFDARQVWDIFEEGNINVFMAVPTIYYKLTDYWKNRKKQIQNRLSASLSSFQLMVSGSAALPVSILEKWREISGHTLLERYGMTEIGMGLSNPLKGERRAGHVGKPLPGVEIRLVDSDGAIALGDESGEIQIKGPGVFSEYWRNPIASIEAFTDDGWFRSGDVAVVQNGYYKILGRNSVDIIKSGGYKISALEIEEELLKYNTINECAVVGIPDEEWGEIIAAFLVTDVTIDFNKLVDRLRNTLPAYKLPRKFKILDRLPRNALGKVTKNELKVYFR